MNSETNQVDVPGVAAELLKYRDKAQQTDLIATLPRRVACSFHGADDFRIFDAPIQPVEVFGLPTAIWHRRLGNHPASRWFRAFIIETTSLEDPAAP